MEWLRYQLKIILLYIDTELNKTWDFFRVFFLILGNVMFSKD